MFCPLMALKLVMLADTLGRELHCSVKQLAATLQSLDP